MPFLQERSGHIERPAPQIPGSGETSLPGLSPSGAAPLAEMAAEASRCAAEQGKFWEFHDELYADQKKLSQSDLLATSRRLGLQEEALESCLASGKFKA